MPVIGWNEDVPSNASYVRDFPTFMQSVATSMAAALGTNVLYWTPTSGSASSVGEMQPGGTRTLFDVESNSSNDDNATLGQKLFVASDTTSVYCYDSAGTYRVGTPFFVELQKGPVYASTESWIAAAQWLLQTGSVTASDGSAVVSFTTAYTKYPLCVTGSLGGSSIGVEYQVSLSTYTGGGAKFIVLATPGYSPGVNPTVYWTSLGTVGGVA